MSAAPARLGKIADLGTQASYRPFRAGAALCLSLLGLGLKAGDQRTGDRRRSDQRCPLRGAELAPVDVVEDKVRELLGLA